MEGTNRQREDCHGFTLAELLIVIVILGMLATVTVFAVRGITDNGQTAACGSELRTMETAQEIHRALNGTFADEAALVSLGTMREASTLYDASGDATSYSITAAAGSPCTGSSSGSAGAAGSPPPPPTATAADMVGTTPTFHGRPSWRYPSGGSGDDEILVLGRGTAMADWIATSDAGVTTTRRTHFIDMGTVTAAQLDTVIVNMRNNGVTDVALYSADDTSGLPGSGGSFADHLAVVGANPDVTVHSMSPGGLAGLFASLG